MTLVRALVAWLLLRLVGRRREPPEEEAERRRIVERQPPAPRWELLVIGLLVAATLVAAGFILIYTLGGDTQAYGLTLGGAVLLIGIACIVMAKRLLPDEDLEEEYPEADPEEPRQVAQILRESTSGFTRKRLLGTTAGVAGVTLAGAAIVPAASFGPFLSLEPLRKTPWHPGRRLMDDHDKLISADDIEEGSFYTAFAEGYRKDTVESPLVLVKLPPDELHLPPGRGDWAPEGIVAYSKICTHAGCAIALYRYPLNPPTAPRPALVCPCHYSTFDPARGAKVLYGPAGRPLPQLPLRIGADRVLEAAGDLSTYPGPAWSGVRKGGD
jgi:ubiquinol-cytochrome c reductase iron-sulfur subunit